ncbi:MAG: hypothetical protein CFE24_11900 [Flavobacterium sp. BFFFF2]|nr:MAG: hypothetical protein CFE24_11900 [Flavobacterium sp. BFFFF2]
MDDLIIEELKDQLIFLLDAKKKFEFTENSRGDILQKYLNNIDLTLLKDGVVHAFFILEPKNEYNFERHEFYEHYITGQIYARFYVLYSEGKYEVYDFFYKKNYNPTSIKELSAILNNPEPYILSNETKIKLNEIFQNRANHIFSKFKGSTILELL